jgi:SAM-dependent methyltransferase
MVRSRMDQYTPSTYGDRIAGIYDEWHPGGDAEQAAEVLTELAGDGAALELAIGTGRVAIPLSPRGVAVQGIDASAAMVAKLRQRPGGADIPVEAGDFADVDVDGRFRLIYVVFNTFFALLTQGDQVRCLRNVAAHLQPGGAFVIEAFVPDPTLYTAGQRVAATSVGIDEVRFDAGRHGPSTQRVDATHVVIRDGDVRLYPVRLRYAWPSELDLMAELAGLRLRDRWEGWSRAPFDGASTKHVSVYELAGA